MDINLDVDILQSKTLVLTTKHCDRLFQHGFSQKDQLIEWQNAITLKFPTRGFKVFFDDSERTNNWSNYRPIWQISLPAAELVDTWSWASWATISLLLTPTTTRQRRQTPIILILTAPFLRNRHAVLLKITFNLTAFASVIGCPTAALYPSMFRCSECLQDECFDTQ